MPLPSFLSFLENTYALRLRQTTRNTPRVDEYLPQNKPRKQTWQLEDVPAGFLSAKTLEADQAGQSSELFSQVLGIFAANELDPGAPGSSQIESYACKWAHAGWPSAVGAALV